MTATKDEEENFTTKDKCAGIDSEKIPTSQKRERERYPSFTYTTDVRDFEDLGSTSAEGDYDYEDTFESGSESEGEFPGDTHVQQDHNSILSDGEIVQDLGDSAFINCQQTDNYINIENQSFPSLFRSDCVGDLSDPNSANESFAEESSIQSSHQRNLTDHQDTTRDDGDGLVSTFSLQDELNEALQGDNSDSLPSRENRNDQEDLLQASYSCAVESNDMINV